MSERLFAFAVKYPLDVISIFFMLLPVLVVVRKLIGLDRVLLTVVLYFLVQFIEEAGSLLYSFYYHNNINLNKASLVVDALLVTLLYHQALADRRVEQRIGVIMAFATIIAVIIAYISEDHYSIVASLFRSLLILFSIFYFNKILSENRILKIVHHPMFWINSGFLIYGMGTFLIWLFMDYLLDATKTSDGTFDLFWSMDQLLSILQCILTAVGLWFSGQDEKNYMQTV